MWRNYFAAALRNLLRNRAYATINICGLALGFAAVLLLALFVRDEYSFDRFFPDHERVYRVMETLQLPGQAPVRVAVTAANIASAMKLDFPEVEAATRLSYAGVALREGDIEAPANAYWVDPDFFSVLPMKVIAGTLDGALGKPDGIVLTRSLARRFFGSETVAGRTIEMDHKHVMRVTAVIEDLPSNTHLKFEALLPGIASFSRLSILDAPGTVAPGKLPLEDTYSYVKLRPGATAQAIVASMRGFARRHVTGEVSGVPISSVYTFSLVPLTHIHLNERSIGDMKPPGDPRTLQAMIMIAVLILIVAGSNFVSMMTARAARRAVEVGVRKSVGATRMQIIMQFFGESLFYVALALALAMFVVELALPSLNGFLQREIAFNYLRDPLLGLSILAAWLITVVAASLYPALVLSMFQPSSVLKGVVALPGGSGRMRQALVVFQFGTLIALIVATLTIHRQTQYAIEDRLRLPTDQIFLSGMGCPVAFRDAVANLHGVQAASCVSAAALSWGRFGTVFAAPSGANISFRTAPLDRSFLELFAVKPLGGRLFSEDRGEDNLLRDDPESPSNPSVVINEAGARALGYASPQAAVNQYARWARIGSDGTNVTLRESASSQIIGVIPDFSVGSVRDVIEPTAYYIDPSMLGSIVVKFDGAMIPETMRAVKALWVQLYSTKQGPATQQAPAPFDGVFLNQYVNDLYADIQRESAIFSAFAGVAVAIGSLGLLGLAVFTAERRTREIGLRKVMGASRWDILRFLGWQFARPVLWANLIAWPLAYGFMHHWLDGFAYHVNLNPLVFVGASALALVIALLTVSGHAVLVARARPTEALRYE
ncbi:MAG: transporter permease [Gammaproteobacteria bacterium]|nr:transporter permease [Gammaproteobacteria bacterium]